jgi:phosphatidate cytidylyltransferase
LSARRLRVRLSIGILLAAAIVGISVLDAKGGAFRIGSLVAASLGSVALVEYTRLAGIAARPAGRGALYAGILAMFWRTLAPLLGESDPPEGLFCAFFGLACAVTLAAGVLARRVGHVAPDDLRDLASAMLGLVVVVLPVLCLVETGYLRGGSGFQPRTCAFFSAGAAPISEKEVGPWLLFVTIFVSKLNDIGGYLVGSVVGRTPLAPGISPKKSVEGALAGLVLGAAWSVAAFTWFCPTRGFLTPAHAAWFGILVSVATQMGDLGESLIKRATGVKDSAVLIPAFGGIFDLLDSFILAAPAGYTLLWLWAA